MIVRIEIYRTWQGFHWSHFPIAGWWTLRLGWIVIDGGRGRGSESSDP